MIARRSLKTVLFCSLHNRINPLSTFKRYSSSFNENNNEEKKTKLQTVKKSPPDIPSFMPVVNIPKAEFACNAFYSLHRPLLGLSIPRPFLVGGMVGQIREDTHDVEEALFQHLASLKPFEPPTTQIAKEEKGTTTLTVEVDQSYFLNHNNNHNEIADYLTAMQEKLDLLYDERSIRRSSITTSKKKMRRLRKRKGFFEKN